MRKLSLVLFTIVGFLLTGCQQDMPLENPEAVQEVQFNIGTGEKGLKGDDDCYTAASYAIVILNDDTANPITLTITSVGGVMYTSILKLPVGDFTITQFLLYDVNDKIVSASPNAGSNYSYLVENVVGKTFTIKAFTKNEITIDVLCFNPADIAEFGFTWFVLNSKIVNEIAFFGDYCGVELLGYKANGANYPNYGDIPMYDMPAIFKIELLKKDATGYQTVSNYNNYLGIDDAGNPIDLYSWGASEASVPPLKILIQDEIGVDEFYKLVISVYEVDSNGDLVWVDKVPWYFKDNMDDVYLDDNYDNTSELTKFSAGSDNVFDFIAGDCNVIEYDIKVEDPGDPNCSDCIELASVTFRYDGTIEADITIMESDQNGTVDRYEITDVQPGTEIIVTGSGAQGKFSKDELLIKINDGINAIFDVSCESSFGPDLERGQFIVVEAINVNGTSLCPVDDQGDLGPCEECDKHSDNNNNDNKPSSLTIMYTGSGSVNVTAYDDNLIPNSSISLGNGDVIVISKGDGNSFSGPWLYLKDGNNVLAEFHVSCSKPLGIGSKPHGIGSDDGLFVVTDGWTVNGVRLCQVDDSGNGGGDGGDDFGDGETAFGNYSSSSICFLDIEGLGNNRWGWTNEFEGHSPGDSHYTIPLYAGASHCNPTARVGEFRFRVHDHRVKEMVFEMDGDYRLTEVHVYIGNDKCPKSNSGAYTVAPGEFDYKNDNLDNVVGYAFDDVVKHVDRHFYLIAHATVVDDD